MHIGFGGHGHQEGHVIDALGLFGKKLADPSATITMPSKTKGALHDRPGWTRKAFGLLLGAKHLSVELLEHRFVVEQIHRTGAARHEQLDDSPYLGRKMPAAMEIELSWNEPGDSAWSICARASPAKPPPILSRKCRRLPQPITFFAVALFDIKELVAIQENSTYRRQSMLAKQPEHKVPFGIRWRSLERA